MEQVVADTVSRQSFNMLLLSIFAGVALVLAAIGIYGLMSYAVEQRTQELGIRMALGADREQYAAPDLAQGMKLAFSGVVLGPGAGLGIDAFDGELAVWCEGQRSGYVWVGGGDIGSGGAGGGLRSGAARDHYRSGDRAAVRVGQAFWMSVREKVVADKEQRLTR